MSQLYDLMVNKMICPVTDQPPVFSWKIKSDEQNVMQTGYRIRVMQKSGAFVWDSGARSSVQQAYIPYTGDPLAPCTEYLWQADVTLSTGETVLGQGAFETASPDWQARWIESTIPRVSMAEYPYGETFSPVRFEKRFVLPAGVQKARVYATACGVYQLRVNGERPDDREFAPEFTVYGKVHYYQTHDVTTLLREGENDLSMYVGDGWYFSAQACPVKSIPMEHPAVLFQLEAELANGSRVRICSDGSETCALGPVVYSDLFQGEKQDLRKGFETPQPVSTAVPLTLEPLCAQPMHPVRPMKLVPATDVLVSPKGETIVDFGQVLAGRARIRVDLPAGQTAVFEYFEELDADGNYINTMFAPQKDTVISAGEPVLHEALFTFHGFRYIRVTGIEDVRAEDYTAVLLTTEKEDLATFECSEPRLNRLYENIRWSQRNNMMSVPTDCPSREKAGWTGDILIYAKTALQNENVTPFLTAWLKNVRADQADDGVVMITTPFEKLYDRVQRQAQIPFGDDTGLTGVAGWGDAIVWVPWDMYRVTGNREILEENFEAMQKWCRWILKRAKEHAGRLSIPEEYEQYLWNSGFHFGEWLIPSEPTEPGYGQCPNSSFYTTPMFGYETIRRMAEVCRALEQESEAAFYLRQAEQMKQAIQKGLMEPDRLPKDKMGAYVLAFAFDLVPAFLWQEYARRLTGLIHSNNDCLDTGFLATPFLLDALDRIGESVLAHQILWQNRLPSWMYEVEHGATAIWEAWNADEARKTGRFVSFDHYAFGCVDDWIQRRICGIDTDTPGYRHMVIAPQPDEHVSWCRRTFDTEAGPVTVSYHENQLEVEIPCNTTATIRWNGKEKEVGSGHYRI